MRVNVYGCGFAGIVSALNFCEQGLQVTGVDIDPNKINTLRKGHSPGACTFIDDLIEKHLEKNLVFHTFGNESFDAELTILALPTPFDGKSLSIDGLKTCCNHILQNKTSKSVGAIYIRSTLPIGGLRQIERFLESDNNLIAGEDFHLFYYPEFMREGTGLDDVKDPPLAIVGLSKSLPESIHLDVLSTKSIQKAPSNEAEALKLLSNAFHATKVTFANEAMRICEDHEISASNVMELFCQDTKLNISSKYLSPGFAWGGGCLGKDTRALSALESDTPLLSSLSESNSIHIRSYASKILKRKPTSIGFVGAGFKENVNDVRESPITKLIRLCNDQPSVQNIFILDSNKELPEKFLGCEKIKFCTAWNELSDSEIIVCRKGRVDEVKERRIGDQFVFPL